MRLLLWRSTVETLMKAARKPVSRKIAPDLYELEVQTVTATGVKKKTVKGFWRTVHGHRLFIAKDGKAYTRDDARSTEWDTVYREHTNADWARAHGEAYPSVHVEPDGKASRQEFYERSKADLAALSGEDALRLANSRSVYFQYTPHGLTLHALQAWRDAIPAGRKFDDARSWVERYIREWEDAEDAGLPVPPSLDTSEVKHVADIGHNVTFDPFSAAIVAGLGANWERASSPGEAQKRQTAFGISVGETADEFNAWQDAKAAEAAVEREQAAARQAAGFERLKGFDPNNLLADIQKADQTGWSGDDDKAEACLKLWAAWVDGGLLLRGRRGGVTEAPIVSDILNGQRRVNANVMKHAIMCRACMGYDWHGLLKKCSALPLTKDNPKLYYTLTRAGELVDNARNYNRIGRRSTVVGGTGGTAGIDIGHENIFDNIVGRADLAEAVANGDKQAKHAVSQAGIAENVEQLLKAQGDDQWKPPKLLTMEGYFAEEGEKPSIFPYQVKGVNWALAAKRGINGFDTGLGKTLVMLATALKLNESNADPSQKALKRGLIICGKNQMSSFVEEAAKACPGAKIVTVEGTQAGRAKLRSAEVKKADVVVMSVSAMNDSSGEFAKWIADQKDISVQADEASRYFKNPNTLAYRNFRAATKDKSHVIGYTATPVPNYDDDYYNVLDLFRPGAAGTKSDFRGRWNADQMRGEGRDAVIKRLQRIQNANRAWVFKKDRTDPDVLQYIPLHQTLDVTFDQPDGWSEATDWIAKYCQDRYSQMTAVSQARQLHQQLCISPALLESRRHPERYKHLTPEHAMLEGIKDYNGPDPKMEHMVDMVKEFHSNAEHEGRVVVVSCEFMGGLDRARVCLERAGIEPSLIREYSGRTPYHERDEVRHAANNGEIAVLLLGAEAGGMGLNLQGNPHRGTGPTMMYRLNEMQTAAGNKQLIERINRTGQKMATSDYMPRIADSVETVHILPLVASKAAIGAILRHGSSVPDDAFGVGASLTKQLEMFGFSEATKREILSSREAREAMEEEKRLARAAREQAAAERKAEAEARRKAREEEDAKRVAAGGEARKPRQVKVK